MSTESLLAEASRLFARARAELEVSRGQQAADSPSKHTTHTRRERKMSTSITLTAQQAGSLYASGQTVDQIAKGNGITYSQARKLIVASGTPIRDASSRLKGRTRTGA